MINMILWKSLPYEIKIVLYIAVLTSHMKQRKHYLKYSIVLNNITEIYSNESVQRDEILKYLESKDGLCINKCKYVRYETYGTIFKKELLGKLQYFYFNNDCLSFTYFLRFVFEILKANDKKKFKDLDQTFKIHFNCTKIRDLYGPNVFIYYLNEGEWTRFTHAFPYGSYLPIRQNDIRRYNNILISHIDFGNYMLDPVSIQEAISNPIFKFSIYDLQENRFVFNGINQTFQKYFIKGEFLYDKGFGKSASYKHFAYKHIFTEDYLNFRCAFRNDSIRYNYLYNKLVFKEYYFSKNRLQRYYYTTLDYKNFKKTITCFNEDILLNKKSGSRTTYHEKEYYKTLWFIADEDILEIIKEYNISNLDTLLY